MAQKALTVDELEPDVQRIGRELVSAFPSPARHPLRTLDEKAMQLTSEDLELRAALFRLVDVTPACRSLDDLAAHLADYLEEVPERPPPLGAAMRMAHTKAVRSALGAAAAAGVRHMAHRFIIGESPREALSVIESQWRHGTASSVDLLAHRPALGDAEEGRPLGPAASITARTSSIRSSRVGTSATGSDSPVPRLSKRIRRENEPSRSKKRANGGDSHWSSKWVAKPRTRTGSSGPSQTTW